jgi:uracil DNA glycosylase
MRVTSALSQSVLPVKQDASVTLLLAFRIDQPGPGQAPRSPLNLSLVIDRSGSMSGAPLKHAIEAAELLVGQLEANDTLSVVVYDQAVQTIVQPTPVTKPGAICKAIHKIKPGGSTNLHGGWAEGCQHVGGRKGGGAVNRVLLLTDGQANVGITAPKKLIEAAREEAEKGVATTTLGFGRGFNEDLLIGMAEAGAGNFYFIETPQDASQVFQIEGESLASLAARNLVVTLKPEEASGATVGEVVNGYPAGRGGGGTKVTVGNVYAGEDKLLAVGLHVPARAKVSKDLPLVTVSYSYAPVGGRPAEPAEGRLVVSAAVGTAAQAEAAQADVGVLRQVARLRVARAKEEAVERADDDNYEQAAADLRQAIADLQSRGLHEELEIAEEVAQLEYFAGQLEQKAFDTGTRKEMRDQSYQGRTRTRADLTARGGAGGSADALELADSAAKGVELVCVKGPGKLLVHAVSEGYDPTLDVILPRGIREADVRYLVDGLELAGSGTFYRPVGAVRRLKGAGLPSVGKAVHPVDPDDPLALTELLKGGGEPWLPLLKPVLEAQPDAPRFIGPGRGQGVVPVRELTFQALKPNPPDRWKVVVFGQNPYPRVESATGIAMFDNTFGRWKDSQFGRVTSIRCIIKAACIWKHKIAKQTSIADIRELLEKNQTAQPPEWFQAMLTQGVLLLNAALTASSDNAIPIDHHTGFWKPVVERLVEEILASKEQADDRHKGVVFAWWGSHAKSLRKVVEKLQKKYPGVPVKHLDHCNPAAQGDIFCDGDHFADVNEALKSLGMEVVDWLPSVGWNQGAQEGAAAEPHADAGRMGDFIAKTMELHRFYLDRLQGAADEGKVALPPVVGVLGAPAQPFSEAIAPVVALLPGLDFFARQAAAVGQKKAAPPTSGGAAGLTEHEAAALYLYTTESGFYREVNAALRDPDRAKVVPYFGYLRLMFSAMSGLAPYTQPLYRGVAADVKARYPKGGTVTWWGVSSCTAKRSVALSFLGAKGARTLFEVRPALAVNIRDYSAFTAEEEYLLLPGTQLQVAEVKSEASKLTTVTLQELPGQRQVS